MNIPTDVRWAVRQRAHFACEFCGVTETDTGGELTIDHFQPHTTGGTDEPENLLYCCHRCNQYKADYWPTPCEDPHLWHPRHEPIERNLLLLADGTLYPITEIGAFTLKRLRLNRPPLVAYRLRKQGEIAEHRLLIRYRDLVVVLEQLHQQQAALLEEQQVLLEEQRRLVQLLLRQQA
jgi:HNH endonuclease